MIQQPPLQGLSNTERWSTRARKRITAISKGLSEVLAGIAEPGMRYATIYMALATGLPAINWGPAFGFCEGLVIALPEFVLIGAFGIAEDSWKAGKKFWAVALFVACIALALIVGATLVDIFLWQFPEMYIKWLNFGRCIVAVSFSVILGKLDDGKSENENQQQHVQPVQNAAVSNISPIQTHIQPVQNERIDALDEKIEKLSALMLQMSQTVNVYISQTDIDRRMDSNRQTVYEACTPAENLVQQIAAPETEEIPAIEAIEPIETVITPRPRENDEPVQAVYTNDAEAAPQAVYPYVQGVAPEVVQIVIDEHLSGTSWTAIASKTGKNYSRIVKPIRDVYMATRPE